jgi:ATP-binding cassette subfamily C protein LapB
MHGFLRTKIVDHILNAYSSNFAEVDIAGTLMRMVRLPNTLFTLMDNMRYRIIPYLIVYSITIAYIGYYDVMLGLLLFVTLAILYYTVLWSPKTCEEPSYQAEFKSNLIADDMDDVLSNLMSVYSQNQQEKEKARLQQSQANFIKEQKAMVVCIYKIKLVMFPIMTMFIILFLYRCYSLVILKKINSGRFVSLFMVMTYVTNSMWEMIGQMRDTIPRWGRLKDGLTIFDTNVSTPELTHVPEIKSSGIVLDNVSFKYPEGAQDIIKGLSLTIPVGQNVALVGRIGCGKSTLLKLIMKYYEATDGIIYWNHKPYTNMAPSELRREIGYVHQYPTLFKRTIYENITYGLDENEVTRDSIRDILLHIGMETIFDNIADGLDGSVGRKGSKLSGGQKQMVWLLRVFFKKASIIILDEPTASVDEETKFAIQKMLLLVMEHKTVIIVTHDKFLLDITDRVITLESGQVISDKLTAHTETVRWQ